MSADHEWTLTPEQAHPKARLALTDAFFWSCSDDNTPFGNDNGADTLSSFRCWRARHTSEPAHEFLIALLNSWEVTIGHWDVTDSKQVAELIAQDEFSLTHRDDVIIALAFGQIVVEGRVDADIKKWALVALERQGTQTALYLWREECHTERRRRLKIMADILNQNWR